MSEAWSRKLECLGVEPGETCEVSFTPPFNLFRVDKFVISEGFSISMDLRCPAISPGDSNLMIMDPPVKGCHCGSCGVYSSPDQQYDIIRFDEKYMAACLEHGEMPAQNMTRSKNTEEGGKVIVFGRNVTSKKTDFVIEMSGKGRD